MNDLITLDAGTYGKTTFFVKDIRGVITSHSEVIIKLSYGSFFVLCGTSKRANKVHDKVSKEMKKMHRSRVK